MSLLTSTRLRSDLQDKMVSQIQTVALMRFEDYETLLTVACDRIERQDISLDDSVPSDTALTLRSQSQVVDQTRWTDCVSATKAFTLALVASTLGSSELRETDDWVYGGVNLPHLECVISLHQVRLLTRLRERRSWSGHTAQLVVLSLTGACRSQQRGFLSRYDGATSQLLQALSVSQPFDGTLRVVLGRAENWYIAYIKYEDWQAKIYGQLGRAAQCPPKSIDLSLTYGLLAFEVFPGEYKWQITDAEQARRPCDGRRRQREAYCAADRRRQFGRRRAICVARLISLERDAAWLLCALRPSASPSSLTSSSLARKYVKRDI